MAEDKILTLHPDANKLGVNIDRRKYDAVKAFIQSALREKTYSFQQLKTKALNELPAQIDGAPAWYLTVVKLDLEARGEKICCRKPGGQVIRISECMPD